MQSAGALPVVAPPPGPFPSLRSLLTTLDGSKTRMRRTACISTASGGCTCDEFEREVLTKLIDAHNLFLLPLIANSYPFFPMAPKAGAAYQKLVSSFAARIGCPITVLLYHGQVTSFTQDWLSLSDLEREIFVTVASRYLPRARSFKQNVCLHDSSPMTVHQLLGFKLRDGLSVLCLTSQSSRLNVDELTESVIPLFFEVTPPMAFLDEPILQHPFLHGVLYHFTQQRAWTWYARTDLRSRLFAWLGAVETHRERAGPECDQVILTLNKRQGVTPDIANVVWRRFPDLGDLHLLAALDASIPPYSLHRITRELAVAMYQLCQ
ncbi:hypothetical protein H9P43_002428 [Blastocladiella emersonii ATCC 22665]|nr:hypothetical protein H9P43_002428 [Blastocladiella emersonii ATCC 22665]